MQKKQVFITITTILVCLYQALAVEEQETEGVAIGIDLGTTYSEVGYFDPELNKVVIIADENDRETVPSMLWYDKKAGKMLVGHEAKAILGESENKIWDAKRIIGRSFKDKTVQKDMKTWPFKIVAGENGNPLFKPTLTSKELELFKQKINKTGHLRPEEVSALVLKYLKKNAERKIGKKVTKAVITVPAYFNTQQRKATTDAGSIAGLEVLRIINEPTSAAIAFGLDENKQDGKKTLIFDLGGGTFDVSIIEIDDGFFDVKSSHGDARLGGQDFDGYLMTMFLKKEGLEKSSLVPNELDLLKNEAEKVKMKLGISTEAEFRVLIGKKERVVKITRAEFEEVLKKTVKPKLIKTIDKALEGAKMKKTDVGHLVLVGGSTRIPIIRKIVEDYLKVKPYTEIDPDKAVAYGAAVQAAILSGVKADKFQSVVIADVTPLPLGIETVGEIMTEVVPVNTKIPVTLKKTFSPAAKNQPSVSINIYQGPNKMVKRNTLLGEFVIKEIAENYPPIEIEFKIDANGIVSVEGVDTVSGKKGGIVLDKVSTISEEEKERIMKEFEENAENDRIEAEIITSKQTMINQAQRLIEEAKDDELKEKIQKILDEVNLINDYTEENLNKIKEIEARFNTILQMAGAQKGSATEDGGEDSGYDTDEDEDEDEL